MYKITTQSVISKSSKELSSELLYNTRALKIHKRNVSECTGNINIYTNEIKKRNTILENYMWGISPFMDCINNEGKL